MNFDAIIARVKTISRLKNDKDIAGLLGLSAADFSNRKKRNTLLSPITEWGINENVNLNWLLTGESKDISSAPADEGAISSDEAVAMADVIQALTVKHKLCMDGKAKLQIELDQCWIKIRKLEQQIAEYEKTAPGRDVAGA